MLYYIFLHNTFIYFPIWFVRLWNQFCSYSETISKTPLDVYTKSTCSRVIKFLILKLTSFFEVYSFISFFFFSVDIYFCTIETHGWGILMLSKFKQISHARKAIWKKKSENSDEVEMEENIVLHKVTLHFIFIFFFSD